MTATTDYTLTYDVWGNVLSVKAGNYTLATYEYAANNGKLLELTYGNDDFEDRGSLKMKKQKPARIKDSCGFSAWQGR